MNPLVGVGALALGAGGLFALDRMALAFLRPHLKPVNHEPVREIPHPVEMVRFPGVDRELAGWMVTPIPGEGIPDPGFPAPPPVLLCHGWTGNATQFVPLARALADAGSPVLAFDVRGHGASGPAAYVTARHFRDDARAAARYLAERTGRDPVLVGHSMGGAAVILAAAEGAPCRGLVLLAAPANILEVTAGYMRDRGLPGSALVRLFVPSWRLRAGEPFPRLHPEGRLAEFAGPTLVLQGEADRRVRPDQARRLAAVARAPLAIFPEVGHRAILEHGPALEAVQDFVADLSGPG